MKIAIAHYSSFDDISGVTTWLVDFCQYLVQASHQVVVHLHHFGADPQEGSILPSLLNLGVETHAVRRTGSLEADTLETLRFLDLVGPSLFLPQCLHAHYFAAAYAGRQGLPWIFTMHSDDPDYWSVAEVLTPETHGGSSVCVSQYLAQQLRQSVPASNPRVIPYGIRLPPTIASFSEQPFRVVYSGRMVERQKCIHLVMHTLVHACKASSRIEAHLIGDGKARASCEQIVRQAGLSGRIHFHGRVPPSQVQHLMQRCHAILLMSEYEGLPVALLEAMAAGVVPVARSIDSGIPELVQHKHTGLLVSKDPASGADALVRLSQAPDLWEHCSGQARNLVQVSYNNDHCFKRWIELIQQHPRATGRSVSACSKTLRQFLPMDDERFQNQYRPSPWPYSWLRQNRFVRRLQLIAKLVK